MISHPLPDLAHDTKLLADVFARDSDPAGLVIAALLAHVEALEVLAKTLRGLVDKAEADALEQARQASLPPAQDSSVRVSVWPWRAPERSAS